MVTYNWMMPKITYDLITIIESSEHQLLEAILLVILFTNLFNHFRKKHIKILFLIKGNL